MGRQLPFDVFVNRKVAKWEHRAREWGCAFVDAVGVSPVEEMTYLWNGYKKMDLRGLEKSLEVLAWSEANPHWKNEDQDEKAILALLRAAALRNLRRHDEAKAVLKQEILCHDPHSFKGHNKDNWTAPTAHYEMAVNFWMERQGYIKQYGKDLEGPEGHERSLVPSADANDAKLVAECKVWVEKAKNWDKYELEARIGMRIASASSAIRKWEAKHS